MRIFISVTLLFLAITTQASYAGKIVVNQVGYLTDWPKVALWLNTEPDADEIELINAASLESVMMLTASDQHEDPQSEDDIRTIDFSSFKQDGLYFLRAGEQQSLPFSIGQDIYQSPLRLLLRSYYLQRCGFEISDTETGLEHAACHLEDGIVKHDDDFQKADNNISAIGGWHDAGDYGKYITTTAITLGRILALYEAQPEFFANFSLDIAESSSPLPDVLDEMRIGLDWMLTMQRADGAVYRKLSGEAWPMDLTPDQDKQTRYVYGISSPDTAKAAAAWAMAARIYQSLLPEQAALYLEAARKSWAYLQGIDQQVFEFHDGDDKGSGPYRHNETDNEIYLTYDWDDRLWAAMELLITTGENPFQDYVSQTLPDAPLEIFEWKNPSGLALAHALFHPQVSGNEQWHEQVKSKVIDRADSLLSNIEESGYQIANNRFLWGSNKMTIEEGIVLIYAYRLSQNTAYLDAAIQQLSYIFGRNHFDMSFVTGVGENPAKAISHLYLSAAKTTLAGLLVGGPNYLAQAKIAPKDKGPLSYIDDTRSYATNEYAIDYNASLIALVGMLITTPYPNNE